MYGCEDRATKNNIRTSGSPTGNFEDYGFNVNNSPKGDVKTEQTCTIIHLVDPAELGKVATSNPRFRIAYAAHHRDMVIFDTPQYKTPNIFIGYLNFNSTVYRR